MLLPGLEQEKIIIAGVDEAGRGCLAGPVVAGAVVLPEKYDLPGLGDSKKLSAHKREELALEIKRQALHWSLGVSRAAIVDDINILQATFRAMALAVVNLRMKPGLVLIDGNKTIPAHAFPHGALKDGMNYRQESVVKGDDKIPEISAASILAKTFRDMLMEKLEHRYPGYGFAEHKGYGTKVHLEALRKLGPCPIHRLTFRGVVLEKPQKKEQRVCLPGI
ncbi:ribonuclease HII [Maridesulfovibrio bastinii]|uniref:ribonuclease HII n=1 Tax=Maridesulfovibrio bastinii TaxID=47157 RepID=UPI00041E4B68|nr:ribonuclease HII [Maridesulfovibrio bastinii]